VIDGFDVELLTLVAAQLAIGLKNAEYVGKIECQQAQIEELRQRLEAENVVLRSEVRAASQFSEIIVRAENCRGCWRWWRRWPPPTPRC